MAGHRHGPWTVPTGALAEGDTRERCDGCGYVRERPQRHWRQLATLHLPISPSVVYEVTEWLRRAAAEDGHQLVAGGGGSEDEIRLGYYIDVQP